MALTDAQVRRMLQRLPIIDHHGEIIEHIAECELRMRLPFQERFLGRDHWQNSGNRVYSGPLLMGFADTAMYACLCGTFGENALCVIQTMTINFLHPAEPVDLIATVRIVRRGARSSYLETHLFSDGHDEPVCHVTATAVVRPMSDAH